MGAFRSVAFFEKSIKLFRNNGETEYAEKVHRELIEAQKIISENTHTFSVKFDITKAVDKIKANFEGLSFEECIIRLTQYVGFEPITKIKERTIEECKSGSVSSLFSNDLLDSNGRTIAKLPSLGHESPESDTKLLELHMFRSCAESYRIAGNIYVRNVLHFIKNNYSIEDSMLNFLTGNNEIIPKGRERIFQKGIGAFLRGEYYESMHILAPQMENLFRNIADEVGGITSTLSDDGISQEKVLSPVFSLPELLDAYENDIIFTFRALLNERAGANIRNRIAHGIIEEYECSSGECLYFGALVIKLLSFTSMECNRIEQDSEKLKNFKQWEENDIKIID